MSQNGQTFFKKSCSICFKIFKVCLTLMRHCALKSQHVIFQNERNNRCQVSTAEILKWKSIFKSIFVSPDLSYQIFAYFFLKKLNVVIALAHNAKGFTIGFFFSLSLSLSLPFSFSSALLGGMAKVIFKFLSNC